MTPEPYTITAEDLHSVTKAEMAFGTMRLLPPFDEEGPYPADYDEVCSTVAYKIGESLFYGRDLPEVECVYKPGFSHERDNEALSRAVRAHLTSFGPKHQRKMYGVAKLILQVMEFK